jgi:hypothetical protein
MSDGSKTTYSGRVPDKHGDPAIENLEETGHSKSDLIIAAFELYAGDGWGQEFLDQYMSDEVDSLEEYALGRVRDNYGLELTEEQRDDLYFGITSIMSGMQFNSKTQAMKGCEELALIDDVLAQDAADYLDNITESGYWE